MRLRSLQLRNYRRYESVDLELPDGIISIIGSNGSGKSTLLEAFAWALFGNQTETVRTGKDSIKRQGAAHTDPCSVRIEFDFEDTGYIVERTMRGKSQAMHAEMYAGDKLLARGTDDVSKALADLFGMDHKSFFISVFARQSELNALASLPKGERKKVILRLLDIESVDEAIRRIREDLRHARDSLDTAREELVTPDGESAIEKLEDDVKELAARKEELAARKKELGQKLKDMDGILSKLRKDLDTQEGQAREKNALESGIKGHRGSLAVLERQREELARELEQLKDKEDELKDQEPKAEKLEKDLQSAREKKEQASEEKEIILSEMARFKSESKQLAREMKDIESSMREISDMGPDSDCPTCRRRLGDTFSSLLDTFKGQLDQRRKTIAGLDKKMAELEARQSECMARAGALDRREASIRERMSKFEKLRIEVRQADRARKKQAETETRISEAVKELKKLEKKLAGIDFDRQAYEASKKAYDGLNRDVRLLDRDFMGLDTELVRNEERGRTLAASLERLREIERKHQGQQERADLLSNLERLMIEFRTHLISRIRPALMSISSELFGLLTDGRYGEIILDDDYDITIMDAGEPHGLERFSGGEKDLANLCLRLAISEIIATRHGTSSFDLIVLDEIFGSQDANRKRNLLSTLNSLSNRFKQIFLITHVDDVKELMGNVIEVKDKPNGTSTAGVMQ